MDSTLRRKSNVLNIAFDEERKMENGGRKPWKLLKNTKNVNLLLFKNRKIWVWKHIQGM